MKKKSKIQQYRELCEIEKNIPLFSQPWWLDGVVGEGSWEVCLVEHNGQIVASMPYIIKKRMGFKLCSMPTLTQTLGPWLRVSSSKYSKQLANQKKLLNQLILQLPSFDYFSQNWHYSQTNWLPFYWQGFTQTNKYTYVIEDLSDIDRVWSNFQENVKTDIRKATKRFNLKVNNSSSINDFIELNDKVFARQGKKSPYSHDFIFNLDQACIKNSSRKIFIVTDKEGNKYAGVYLVWSGDSAYYLMGGSDPKLRNTGAISLCIWEAIKFSSNVAHKFDFEGSMIESIERFFRAFGAKQKSYYNITKTTSLLIRFREALLSIK